MIDASQLLFTTSFKITDKISVRHSTVGDIVKMGEDRYFRVLSILTNIPSDAKSVLWDAGIDWVELSDLEFFAMTVPALTPEESGIFLPGLDFSKFSLYKRPDGDFVFADRESGIIIDERGYRLITEALCTIHKIKKKPERPSGKLAREWLIEEDRENRKIAAAKKDEKESSLMPLISSMVNRSNFKYDYSTIKDLLFGQFMDAVARIQLVVATDQLIQGVYAGNVNTKKLDKKKLDWTRSI